MRDQVDSTAALTLVESLIIALQARGVPTTGDVEAVYDVAISVHGGAAGAAIVHEAAA